MKKLFIFMLFLFLIFLDAFSDIVEKKDKNGKKVLENKGSKVYDKISKNIKFKKSPKSSSIHRSYLLKIKELSKKYQHIEPIIKGTSLSKFG